MKLLSFDLFHPFFVGCHVTIVQNIRSLDKKLILLIRIFIFMKLNFENITKFINKNSYIFYTYLLKQICMIATSIKIINIIFRNFCNNLLIVLTTRTMFWPFKNHNTVEQYYKETLERVSEYWDDLYYSWIISICSNLSWIKFFKYKHEIIFSQFKFGLKDSNNIYKVKWIDSSASKLTY